MRENFTKNLNLNLNKNYFLRKLKMKRYSTLIFLGVLNIVHAATHIFQFVQSMFLMSYSITHKETWFHHAMESPWMGVLWGLLGVLTLYLGVRDYRHHKHHKD